MSLALYWKKGAVWGQISGTVTDQTDLMTYLDANFFKQGGNSFASTAVIGTNDSSSLVFRTNGVDRWSIERNSGYMARGSGTQGFALQLFGSGAAAGMTFGDLFDPTTPYCFVGEYGGVDSDQIEIYGQKGAGVRAGVYGSTTPQVWVAQAGNVGVGTVSPSASAELDVVSTTRGFLPPRMTTVQRDAISAAAGLEIHNTTTTAHEVYDGTRWAQVPKMLVASASLNFPSTGAGAVSDLTVTVTGAALNDGVFIGAPNGSVTATASYFAWVSAANTVTVRFSPKATEDPASGTFRIFVIKNT